MALHLENDLKSACGVALGRTVAFELFYRMESCKTRCGWVGAAHSSCGELRELVDFPGGQCFLSLPAWSSWAVFCAHLVFLADEDAHKQTQNS